MLTLFNVNCFNLLYFDFFDLLTNYIFIKLFDPWKSMRIKAKILNTLTEQSYVCLFKCNSHCGAYSQEKNV